MIDTHCHIHDPEFFDNAQAESALHEATDLEALLLVGTSLNDSRRAIEFAHVHPEKCWAAVGIHPHEAASLSSEQIDSDCQQLAVLAKDKKVRAIGECGFDFYYNDRSEVGEVQSQLLERQLAIAKTNNLPVSFHVRGGFDEFWPVYDKYRVPGVLHSFTDSEGQLEKALERGLMIGVNGIATFTKDRKQCDMFAKIPLESIVVETDAPFLTPNPIRGTMNVPRNVTYVTSFLAELRGEDVRHINQQTTANARNLFAF